VKKVSLEERISQLEERISQLKKKSLHPLGVQAVGPVGGDIEHENKEGRG
jgi:hypothetical protein